jgi:hypothetical protein
MTSLFPGCGPDCLKEKKLAALKAAMDANPADKQATIDYYTLLNGPDWLADHKESMAKHTIEPLLSGYRQQFDTLTAQLNSQSQFADLAKSLASDGGMPYLKKDYEAEKSKADTLDRQWKLSGTPETEIDVLGIFLYIIVAVLGAAALFLAYSKYRKYTSPPPSIIGGNRLK